MSKMMLCVEEWWEETPAAGVKCVYAGQVYSVGTRVDTLSSLKQHLRATIPYVQSSDFHVSYTDPDGDCILITTDASLLEAYRVTHNALRLTISRYALAPKVEIGLDEVMDYGRLEASLSGVFVICLQRKAIGMGVVIAPQTGVCVCPSLRASNTLTDAFALFTIPGFPHYFDPQRTKSFPSGLIFLTFKARLGSEVCPVEIDETPPRPGMRLLTLHRTVNNNPKAILKWVEVKTTTGEMFDYDTKEQCGPNGSPLLTPEFRLFGIQLTDTKQHNTALCSSSLLAVLPPVHSVIEIED